MVLRDSFGYSVDLVILNDMRIDGIIRRMAAGLLLLGGVMVLAPGSLASAMPAAAEAPVSAEATTASAGSSQVYEHLKHKSAKHKQLKHKRVSKASKRQSKKQSKRRTSAAQSVALIFRSNVGKYPGDIKLLRNPALRKRLGRLIGESNLRRAESQYGVETPIVRDGNSYSFSLCMPHNCDSDFLEVNYNVATGRLSATMSKDECRRQYSE